MSCSNQLRMFTCCGFLLDSLPNLRWTLTNDFVFANQKTLCALSLTVNITNSVQRRQRQTQRRCDLERPLCEESCCVKKNYLSDWIQCCHFHYFIRYKSYVTDFQYPTILLRKPCIETVKNQQDTLFTFNLFQWFTATCFKQAYCSSSGGTTLYTQHLVCVMRLCWLAVGRIGTILPTASQHKRIKHTKCCIYRVEPPDDEQ